MIVNTQVHAAAPTKIHNIERTRTAPDAFSLKRFYALAMRLINARGILTNKPAKLPQARDAASFP